MAVLHINDFSVQVGFKGYGLSPEKLDAVGMFEFEGKDYKLRHGSVVIAAITSCTNTSNPSVMLGAGTIIHRFIITTPYSTLHRTSYRNQTIPVY